MITEVPAYDKIEIARMLLQVSVFDFIQPGIDTGDIGLDRALLAALYHKDEMSVEKRKTEIRLALAWRNVEYARYEIFNAKNPDYSEVSEYKEILT